MTTLPQWTEAHEKFRANLFWTTSGAILAMVALLANLLTDAMAIASAQVILHRQACVEGLGDSMLIVILGVAVTSSVVFGGWLVNVRRQIGRNATTHDGVDWGRLARSRFAVGSMSVFIPMTPLKWLLILSIAFCH